MKKALLLMVALVAIAVSCGSKYPEEMTKLVTETTAKFDSVQTMTQFETVSQEYATKVGELTTQFGQDASQEDVAKVTELQQGMVSTIEAALQRAVAASAAQDTLVVTDSVAVTEVAVK